MEGSLKKARDEIERVDREMTALFLRRMEASETIAVFKKQHGMAVCDPEQEKTVMSRNLGLITDLNLRGYYGEFMSDLMDMSRRRQYGLMAGGDALTAEFGIVIERGCISRAGELLDLGRKVLIVTDDGVPHRYAETVAAQCREPEIFRFRQGEDSKNLSVLESILSRMLELGFTRDDCVVSVGGGVCGDLAGFAASVYMRGIDLYNIPTTVLAQADASVGGKTAVDLGGVKNAVGTFHTPKGVLTDTELLETLPERHIANGLAEALKVAVIMDEEMFGFFENGDPVDRLEEIIARSVRIKCAVTARDPKDTGIRRALNFGHTIGHGIESLGGRLHGECVALGMIPMCSPHVRERIVPVLTGLGLPTCADLDEDRVCKAMLSDKKMSAGRISVTKTDGIGSFRFDSVTPEELREALGIITQKD